MAVPKQNHPQPDSEARRSAGEFWRPSSFEELARDQGVQPVERLEELLGGWPEDQIDDGFEKALEGWRRHDPPLSEA